MAIVVVTLMQRGTNATKTLTMRNRHGGSVILIHKKMLAENPGWFIRKSTIKR